MKKALPSSALFLALVLACVAGESIEKLRKSAELGDAQAQLNLGKAYTNGKWGKKDPVEAVKWFRKAAEQGNAAAQFSIGTAYFSGEGVTEDYAEAVKWFQKAADQGNDGAQNALGTMYNLGIGVKKDLVEAAKWFRKAAEQGNAYAQYSLGEAYFFGEGVTKDDVEATKWLRKAADGGDAYAQFALGTMYNGVEGVKKDSVEAAKWFRKAAEQGNAAAQNALGRMYAEVKYPFEAVKWYQKSAERGDADAQYALGMAYFSGEGVTKDYAEAAKWFQKSAERRNVDAQSMLGTMYVKGDGVAKDAVEAVKWFREAAYQGDSPSQRNLGVAYATGEGLLKNSVEALAWLNIAAMAGDESTMKDRDTLERSIGTEGALAAQQRSKQILNEIEVAKRTSKAPADNVQPSNDSPAGTDQNPKASGSGAIVTAQGHVLTAAHVVAGAKRMTVTTGQGVKTATILRVDEANDLAVLKITEGKYAPLPIASSRKVQLGQSVATIGFPNIEIQGFSPKVTRGEISSFNGIGDDPRAWQISCPVQPGNSGGPLLDESGNLVGVVVSKLGMKAAKLTGDIPQNVNYAVKGAYALALLEPYLGNDAPEPNQPANKPRFEDMVARAQDSVVLILVY